MSRKTILTVVAILAAIGGVISSTFGLTLNGAAAATGLGVILLYVFNEAKADKVRLASQRDKWKDPKFWMAVVAATVSALGTAEVKLPIDPNIISAALAFVIGILFKKQAAATT